MKSTRSINIPCLRWASAYSDTKTWHMIEADGRFRCSQHKVNDKDFMVTETPPEMHTVCATCLSRWYPPVKTPEGWAAVKATYGGRVPNAVIAQVPAPDRTLQQAIKAAQNARSRRSTDSQQKYLCLRSICTVAYASCLTFGEAEDMIEAYKKKRQEQHSQEKS